MTNAAANKKPTFLNNSKSIEASIIASSYVGYLSTTEGPFDLMDALVGFSAAGAIITCLAAGYKKDMNLLENKL